jgi:hypothetical protein
LAFKDFVENRVIHLTSKESIDDFFAKYDQALDAADRDFRVKHGIYFTDLYLSKFAMWLVRQKLPNLGKNYLVIDPACGSGNLVTNWRSPLELRHKVVSEIEPELLFAIDRRMRGDAWHDGKFTVVPRVSENAGLNFLDRSAQHYLEKVGQYLRQKGLKPDKPIAFLCNPPYRSDDDQTAGTSGYEIDPAIVELTGRDAASERYCCFLAQMKLISEAAEDSGLPGDSLLLLFTKSAWLTKRAIFEKIRSEILGSFDNLGGMLVDGREFFQIKGSWPVAFTMWRYRGRNAKLNAERAIPLRDMTWLKRDRLAAIQWGDDTHVEQECRKLFRDPRSLDVQFGEPRMSIRIWSGETRLDFMRGRRSAERNQGAVGGLPIGDARQKNRKAYGEADGTFIGFMDDLTPCRVKRSIADRPWFRLNTQFMDVKKNRCFSGPPDHFGFCAKDLVTAKRLFFWYALARTFLQHPYPMWVDSDDMWEPFIPANIQVRVFQAAFAIGYAENECVSTTFPGGNPVLGARELIIRNPLTPVHNQSFWSSTLSPFCVKAESTSVTALINAVDDLFARWRRLFKSQSEIPISQRPYLLGPGGLTVGAGITQIRDYAKESEDPDLRRSLAAVQEQLRQMKSDFFELVTSSGPAGIDYFGLRKKPPLSVAVPKTPRGEVARPQLA